ncbi:NAD(P)-dependent oxidoreductase [Microbacterium sp. SORGH_AS_0862]|uniref:NAD(P)-dependent oxidoreductase n=1 Tax=Microbacterium sp. SORGH_AS_0862 TaxID=3041789 RepID=UPI00278F8C5C|nr:NAD(P)H-binding protein [Microbacterium sp. SORGH_AS_0862]MDQ1205522.1 putative NADH-flavin reductase [Microbacterium sp. SORGH_AS_0862]
MKVAVISAHGRVGSRIVTEAVQRGHHVVGVGIDEGRAGFDETEYVRCDVGDVTGLEDAVRGVDAVVYAGVPNAKGLDKVESLIEGIITACKRGGVERLLIVGGGGTAEIAPGKLYLYTKYFSKTIRPIVAMHERVLDRIRQETELDWVVQTPPAMMEENVGSRTGTYRVGKDELVVTDPNSTDYPHISTLSMQDYAVAMIDEIETPRHHFARYTVGY